MRHIFFLICIVPSLIILDSCKKESNPIADDGSLSAVFSGTVLDKSGSPLSGVAVHYFFSSKPSPVFHFAKTTATIMVSFSLPESLEVTLQLFRLGTTELLETPIHGKMMPAGNHSIQINTSQYTNGFYISQMTTKKFVQELIFPLIEYDYNVLDTATPLAITDNNGHFSLPVSLFGIGRRVLGTNERGGLMNGIVVDSIQFYFMKKDIGKMLAPSTIDTTRSTTQTFQFK